MTDVLIREVDDGVAILTMNRPEAMNALSQALRQSLATTFAELAADETVGAIILTGAGRAFSAGVDLKELGGEAKGSGAAGDAVTRSDIVRAMHDCPQPIIGAINGFAITGGFEIALACDVLVASTAARFADTHARVGILPAWGLSQKLSRLIGIYRAKELSLTGNFLSAEKAEAWGLVNRVVEPAELLSSCRALAREMLSSDPITMRAYKRLIDRGFALPYGEGLELEREAARDHFRSVDPAKVAERRRAIQERGRNQN